MNYPMIPLLNKKLNEYIGRIFTRLKARLFGFVAE